MTGRPLMLSGSADTEDAAVLVCDQLRGQVRDNTAARTNVTLGYLLDEWLSEHQAEETTRASYRNLRNCIRWARNAWSPDAGAFPKQVRRRAMQGADLLI